MRVLNIIKEAFGCRKAFAPLVEAGFVAFAYGGAEQGRFLCHHKLVDRIHLTGSAKTYDAIVWGGKPKVTTHGHLSILDSRSLTKGFYLRLPRAWKAHYVHLCRHLRKQSLGP